MNSPRKRKGESVSPPPNANAPTQFGDDDRSQSPSISRWMKRAPRDPASPALALWKDADADIPILKQANAEYGKLQ